MTSPNILVRKLETPAVMRGRGLCLQMIDRVGELVDRGREPVRIKLGDEWRGDLLAFFDYATVFDGVLPDKLSGVPIEFGHGAGRALEIEVRQ